MRSLRSALALASLSLALLATGCAVEPSELIEETSSAVELDGAADAARDVDTYYVGRQDARRCRWPLCGGVWVHRVNRPLTRCLDGSLAEECYVALVDTEALGGATVDGFAGGRALVTGEFAEGDAGEFGPYAVLRVEHAWTALTDAPAEGSFYRIDDNGRRCVRAPCFSLDQQLLNRPTFRRISGLDLDGIGATEEQLATAIASLADGGLLTAGYTYLRRSTGAITHVATQAYVPVRPLLAPGACNADADCALTLYGSPVTSAADCYCPGCPVAVNGAEAEAYQAGWQTFCSETHGPEVCPARPCAPPPPPACNAGVCGFGAREL